VAEVPTLSGHFFFDFVVSRLRLSPWFLGPLALGFGQFFSVSPLQETFLFFCLRSGTLSLLPACLRVGLFKSFAARFVLVVEDLLNFQPTLFSV